MNTKSLFLFLLLSSCVMQDDATEASHIINRNILIADTSNGDQSTVPNDDYEYCSPTLALDENTCIKEFAEEPNENSTTPYLVITCYPEKCPNGAPRCWDCCSDECHVLCSGVKDSTKCYDLDDVKVSTGFCTVSGVKNCTS